MDPDTTARAAEPTRHATAAAETGLLEALTELVAAWALAGGATVALIGSTTAARRLARRAMVALLVTLRRLVAGAVDTAWSAGERDADRMAERLRDDPAGRLLLVSVTEADRRRQARDPAARARRRALAAEAFRRLVDAVAGVPQLVERRWAGLVLALAHQEQHAGDRGPRFPLTAALPHAREAALEARTGTVAGRAATRLRAAQAALDRLAGDGITGFVDTAGRRWQLASYVEMATRTITTQAALNATLDRLADHGIDLVRVTDAPGECVRCRPWEGRVLSVSGRTAGYPPLVEAITAGLFHPNCRHQVSAYLPGITRPLERTADPAGDLARQRTRALERRVRAWRRREAVALTPEAKARARAGASRARGDLFAHIERTSPKTRRYATQRIRVTGAR
jgi:hypothetical protein